MKDAVILEHVEGNKYRITHQDDRIERDTGRLFIASNGMEVWSCSYPAYVSACRWLYLRGAYEGEDSGPLIIPHYDIEAVKIALSEFNAHCHKEWGEDHCEVTEAPSLAASPLPEDADERKAVAIYRVMFKYFPHSMCAISKVMHDGNEQHHPGTKLHWDTDKSVDELDAMMRHVIDEDWDKVAARAMMNLERKLTGQCHYENGNL